MWFCFPWHRAGLAGDPSLLGPPWRGSLLPCQRSISTAPHFPSLVSGCGLPWAWHDFFLSPSLALSPQGSTGQTWGQGKPPAPVPAAGFGFGFFLHSRQPLLLHAPPFSCSGLGATSQAQLWSQECTSTSTCGTSPSRRIRALAGRWG